MDLCGFIGQVDIALKWTVTAGVESAVGEVDGDVHNLQKEEDARREKVLRELGLRVVRFGNDEVVKELSAAVEKIKGLIEK